MGFAQVLPKLSSCKQNREIIGFANVNPSWHVHLVCSAIKYSCARYLYHICFFLGHGPFLSHGANKTERGTAFSVYSLLLRELKVPL